MELKSRGLEEANAALKVLLKHREEDRKELESRLVANVKQLVLPHVEKLKKGRLEASRDRSRFYRSKSQGNPFALPR